MPPNEDHVARMLDECKVELPDVPVESMRVIARILRAARHLDHEIGRGLARYGLSHREYDVLSALRRGGPPYARTASDLGHAILFSSGGLTKLLERLERAGLVVREPDPFDRRVVRAALTDAGRELQTEAMEFAMENEERMLASLSAEEREHLADHLQKLLVSLELADSRWPLRQRGRIPRLATSESPQPAAGASARRRARAEQP